MPIFSAMIRWRHKDQKFQGQPQLHRELKKKPWLETVLKKKSDWNGPVSHQETRKHPSGETVYSRECRNNR